MNLWSTAKRIQSFPSKGPETIIDAPFYNLHNYLNIIFVLDLIPEKVSKFHHNFTHHSNPASQTIFLHSSLQSSPNIKTALVPRSLKIWISGMTILVLRVCDCSTLAQPLLACIIRVTRLRQKCLVFLDSFSFNRLGDKPSCKQCVQVCLCLGCLFYFH